jgi:hypothetical protein
VAKGRQPQRGQNGDAGDTQQQFHEREDIVPRRWVLSEFSLFHKTSPYFARVVFSSSKTTGPRLKAKTTPLEFNPLV